MNSQEIVDYVMNTPHNTNPAILKQMIEESGGTGGSKSFVVIENYDTNEKSANMSYDELRNALENNEFPVGWVHGEGENSDNSVRSIITYIPYEDYIEFLVLEKWGGEAYTWAYRSDGTIEQTGGNG